jgi:hypothetical protein
MLQKSGQPTGSLSDFPCLELHPQTLTRLNFSPGDLLQVQTQSGSLLAAALPNPALHPAAAALALDPTSPNHCASLQPLDLIGKTQNESGSLALNAAAVSITNKIIKS